MRVPWHNIRLEVSPNFENIVEYCRSIDDNFQNLTFIIQNRRNDIRLTNVNELYLVVKSFKGMYWPNRLAYSIFRKSKAQRSFETSIRLLKMGFHVPAPVAYIDYYRWGFLQSSYFVSVYHKHEDFATAVSKYSKSHNFTNIFASFAFRLHQAGVNQHDFSNGNILCNIQDGDIHFSMVDLNRVHFGTVRYCKGLRSLSKLNIEQSYFDEILKKYSELSEQPFEKAARFIRIQKYVRNTNRRFRFLLKRIFFPSRVQRTM